MAAEGERTGDALAAEGGRPWHALAPDAALAALGSSLGGLGAREARERLSRHGPNALLVAPPVSAARILGDQCRSVIVLLLAVAAGVSLALGDVIDAVAIAAVLVVNVAIGFWTEWRARRTMDALRRMEIQRATALRDGAPVALDARDLVPGDVVVLEAGEAVPADVRLLAVAELECNEAPLTGESVPVLKRAEPVAADTVLPERVSMAYKGTLAVSGGARALVVATGAATEIGRISELVQRTEDERTPLERRLAALGRRLVWVALLVAATVALLGLARGGSTWLMIETGIALAVAAVPEGLPVVATITLAVGMRRMARRHALVRRLPAVEALGSTTVVCTDKTGTLTAGEMTATVLALCDTELAVTGSGYAPHGELRRGAVAVAEPDDGSPLGRALRVCALANRAAVVEADGPPGRFVARGDPTEAALLVLARKAHRGREVLAPLWPEVGAVPFSSERMLMATFHRRAAGAGRGGDGDERATRGHGERATRGGELLACVKGAPGRLLARCTRFADAAGEHPLDEVTRRALADRNRALASRGLRVLALADRVLPAGAAPGEPGLQDLCFLGHVGLLDPPAPGVVETIERLRRAGIRTVMITGDQRLTAAAVARELGVLAPGEAGDDPAAGVVDGADVAAATDEQLVQLLATARAFSRTAPADKLRIVYALQARGEVVGMLGDGVNDAAALKGADIGVAMGRRGTDVAKETADVVLADDRLGTVAEAVEGGRVIDDNIRKFIFYLFSCNAAEVLVLFLSSVYGLPLPLQPLQILWLNIVTDVFPALALAVEPPEEDVMLRAPRRQGGAILSLHFARAVGIAALLLTAGPLVLFWWAITGAPDDLSRATTLAFLAVAGGQLLHVLNARSRRPIVITRAIWANGWSWLGVGISAALLVVALWTPPLARVLDLTRPTPREWLLVVLASLPALVVGQLQRVLRAHRLARRGADAGRPRAGGADSGPGLRRTSGAGPAPPRARAAGRDAGPVRPRPGGAGSGPARRRD